MRKSLLLVFVVVAACDTFESEGHIDAIDAPPISLDARIVTGPRHTYVVSRLMMPTSAAEATQLGLDIDDRPNDGIDNQLGVLLASIRTLAPGVSAAADISTAIDRGQILLLADVRADDLQVDAGAAAFLHVGAAPQPPACSGPSDTACRGHLQGNATFLLAAGVALGTEMPGSIVAGTLHAGAGSFTLPLVFGTGPAVNVPVQKGQVSFALTEARLQPGSKLGGAIAQVDVDAFVIPALHASLVAIVDRDCPPPRTGPNCNCGSGSSGAQVLGFLDTNDDCQMTLAEVRNTIDSILTDDIDLDDDGVNDAVSIGLGVEGVGATFEAPP